jgi:alkylation response protein AidB-like acyl-CoA dehydrogenase
MNEATKETLLEALPRLVEIARQHVEQGERERNITPPVVDALVSAGVFRMCRPKAYGGLELDPPTAIYVLERLGMGDPSAAWCAMVSGAQGNGDAWLPPEGAKEMFTGPNVVCAAVAAPSGRAVAVEGGYRVSGLWKMASNIRQSQWLGAGAVVYDGDVPRKQPIVAFIRTSECKIVENWHVSGLIGTGSEDFEINDVFVPMRRAVQVPREAHVESTLNGLPVPGFAAAGMAAITIGIARSALDELARLAKNPADPKVVPLANRTYAQVAFARAESNWRAARAYLYDEIRALWSELQAGRKLDLAKTASLRLANVHVTETCAAIVDSAFTTGGAASMYLNGPLQRYVRDVHAATLQRYVTLPAYEPVGRVLLGSDGEPPVL